MSETEQKKMFKWLWVTRLCKKEEEEEGGGEKAILGTLQFRM